VALIDDARVAVRVTTSATDTELEAWVDAAIADMRRCGVKDALLDEQSETFDPLVRSAVILYVKANYGFDNSEAPRFMAAYRATVAGLLNSRANEYLDPEVDE
jgi:hypothetical protein